MKIQDQESQAIEPGADLMIRTHEELLRRDAEAIERIAALRAALSDVRSEREAIWQGLAKRREPRAPAFGNLLGWILFVVFSTAVAWTLYLLYTSDLPQGRSPVPTTYEAVPSSTPTTAGDEPGEPVREQIQGSAPEKAGVEIDTPGASSGAASADHGPKQTRKGQGAKVKHPRKKGSKPEKKEEDILDRISRCGDDPLCGSDDRLKL